MSNWQISSDGKSAYMQTCNLLSQYLKGKATLKDLMNLGINGEGEIPGKTKIPQITKTETMDFLTNMEEQSTNTINQDEKLVDDVPKSATTISFREMDVSIDKASNSCKEKIQKELKAAQLSIFYGGKVIVFDDFPADKARAMMLLASKGSPHNSCGVFNTTNMDKTGPLKLGSNSATNTFDLPIARRSSLHRFLGRRKDRDTARAPYQVQNPLPSSSKNKESTSMIRDQSHFDLNFTL